MDVLGLVICIFIHLGKNENYNEGDRFQFLNFRPKVYDLLMNATLCFIPFVVYFDNTTWVIYVYITWAIYILFTFYIRKYLVLGRDGPYLVKEHSESKNKYTEGDIINMLEFLVDNIFVVFAGKVFQQITGIPMGTNCAPLLADIFLLAGKKRLASQFNFTYRCIDVILSINKPDLSRELSRSDVSP